MGRNFKIDRSKLLKIGGASRDRTDDLIVANDTVHHFIVLNRLDLSSGYGPLRSNSQIGSPGVASQLARSTRKKFEETGR
jgi:hypothetical protein